MEDLEVGTKVCLTADARDYTYEDMDWKNDRLVICHAQKMDRVWVKFTPFIALKILIKKLLVPYMVMN